MQSAEGLKPRPRRVTPSWKWLPGEEETRACVQVALELFPFILVQHRPPTAGEAQLDEAG